MLIGYGHQVGRGACVEVRISSLDAAAWYSSSVHSAVIALVKEALHRALQVSGECLSDAVADSLVGW